MAGKRKRKPPPEGVAESGPPAPRADGIRPRSEPTTLRTAVLILLALASAGGVVGGLAWVGREAGADIAGRGRYVVRVADIACDAPPGSDRATFLTEVRYLGGLPETVQSVDPSLTERLSVAFVAHPWVAAVDGVTVSPGGEIRVALRYRVPVLAVKISAEDDLRAVDAGGMLLPPSAKTEGLPELTPAVSPPDVPAGRPWPNPDVKRAAELTQQFPARRIEKTPRGWRVTQPDGKVLVVGW